MPNPFGVLSKAAKAEIAADLEKTVEVNGRTMKKKDMVEFEIEKRLGAGLMQTQPDIMRALELQGIKVDPNYVKERMAVARRRNPVLKTDPKYRRMEANWIIEKGMELKMSWDEISDELVTSGFNGPKIVAEAKASQAKRLMQRSNQAAIDNGESGPNAGPPEELYPTGPVQDLADMRNMTDEGLLSVLKKVGDEAARRRKSVADAARQKGAAKVDDNGFDWKPLDEMMKMWRDYPDITHPTEPHDNSLLEAPLQRATETTAPPEELPPPPPEQ